MSKDHYQLLGVSKSASADEIKRAFRKLAHEYHPDKKTGDEKDELVPLTSTGSGVSNIKIHTMYLANSSLFMVRVGGCTIEGAEALSLERLRRETIACADVSFDSDGQVCLMLALNPHEAHKVFVRVKDDSTKAREYLESITSEKVMGRTVKDVLYSPIDLA